MTLLAVTALLIGGGLGQRFKVLILFPTVLIFFVGIFAYGMAQNIETWDIFLRFVLVIAAFQLGYFVGALLRLFPMGAHIEKGSSEAPTLLGTPTR